METAKVDVRKLQMLNDRINQTIDALNQVRLSVHGMSHTGTIPGINGINGTQFANTQFANTQFAPTGYPVVNPFGTAFPFANPNVPSIGFGHTAGIPMNQAFGLQNSPVYGLQNPQAYGLQNTVG